MGKGSLYLRGDVWWMGYYDAAGKRRLVSTGLRDKKDAEKLLLAVRRKTAAEKELGAAGGSLRAYFETRWLPERAKLGLAQQDDEETRIRLHVLPKLGNMRLDEIETRHVVALIRDLRGTRAPRTIRNTIGDLSVLMRDAKLDRLINENPCDGLRRGDLPAIQDVDPSWRASAVYTREEVESLLLDPRIQLARRIDYAIAALTGARNGERFFLRWKHWNESKQPLGCLAFEGSYDSKRKLEKRTKTKVSRYFPVHPLLAAMLSEWKLSGWAETNGREPTQDDLIVPHNGRQRTGSVTYKGLQRDLETLGLRGRRAHDFRRTTISLALADGARKDIMQTLTHPSPRQAFDLYLSVPWPALCAEVAKLRIGHLCYTAATSPVGAAGFESEAESKRCWLSAALRSELSPSSPPETADADEDCSNRSSGLSMGLLWMGPVNCAPAVKADSDGQRRAVGP